MKVRSAEFHDFKRKEFLGDALIKFVVGDIYCTKFDHFQTNTHVPKIELIIRNHIMIKLAKAIGIEPHPEDVIECGEFKPDKPYANAFEVHVYDLYIREGIEAVYNFVDAWMFTPEVIAKVEQWYAANVEQQKVRQAAQDLKDLDNERKREFVIKRLNNL